MSVMVRRCTGCGGWIYQINECVTCRIAKERHQR